MKILHYALGFPPYRSGGLTNYCMDIMNSEMKQGHDVSMLWPGRMKGGSVCIKKGRNKGITSFEMINPMPVSILSGIRAEDIGVYTEKKDGEVFRSFFLEHKFDVIHLHTIMGLPAEFLKEAGNMRIPIVYTSHDYFGICPVTDLMADGSICRDLWCRGCRYCNKNAPSLKVIKIKQSTAYRVLKKLKFLKKYRRHNQEEISKDKVIYTENDRDYQNLRKFYYDIFSSMTYIHFNSTITEKNYRYFGVDTPGQVISISNSGIRDRKSLRKLHKKVRIGYLTVASRRKGWFLLRDVLDELRGIYPDRFEVVIFTREEQNRDYIVQKPPYVHSMLPEVMDDIDVVILPSLWPETFGFTVAEAQSFGIPSIVSTNVGAGDIIEEGKSGFIIEPDRESLKQILVKIIENPKILSGMNRYITDNVTIKDMDTHAEEIVLLYKGLIKKGA